MNEMTETRKPGLARHIPLLVILTVAVIGAVTLRDYLSFDTLAENREALLAFRDANLVGMALAGAADLDLVGGSGDGQRHLA